LLIEDSFADCWYFYYSAMGLIVGAIAQFVIKFNGRFNFGFEQVKYSLKVVIIETSGLY
jgi:hypothetical protein